MTPFMVLPLLPPLNMFYETPKNRAESNRKLAEAPAKRRGGTVELVKKVVGETAVDCP